MSHRRRDAIAAMVPTAQPEAVPMLQRRRDPIAPMPTMARPEAVP